MLKNLLNHFRCFGFLFQNHGAAHFAIGFGMTILFTPQLFEMALLAGGLVCVISGMLNLATYFWRHRFNPEHLVEHHLSNFLQHYGKGDYNLKRLRRDLECLLHAPYLKLSQRQRVESLYQQAHLQPIPVWQLRYQLEQLLRG